MRRRACPELGRRINLLQQRPGKRGFRREGWLDYEAEIAAASEAFDPVDIDENDLITINYASGATAKRFRTAAAGPALSAAWP